MKYNAKYDRWVSKDGLVYRYDKKNDRLVLCKLTLLHGYQIITCQQPKKGIVLIHRMVYETFNGEIPQGYEIDHINTVKTDNNLENLRCVTHTENNNNPLTRKHISESLKGKPAKNKRKGITEFGKKFIEHYGFGPSENTRLYKQEYDYYWKYNKVCSWEVVDKC